MSTITMSCDQSTSMFGSPHRHHLFAQKLNNTAASCIEIGQYGKAISILAKALRLCKEEQEKIMPMAVPVLSQPDDSNKCLQQQCSCHYCSVDGCIVPSEANYCSDIDDDGNGNGNDDGCNIYRRPIYVYEGHNMGSTLFHIIAFNLAISHHLTAIDVIVLSSSSSLSSSYSNNDENDENEKIISKALQFYELAYEYNLHRCSVQFDMIICNNLSHIYRHQEQKEQEQEYQGQQCVVAERILCSTTAVLIACR